MPAAALSANDLFEAFFDLSLTGGVLYDPVPDAAGEVVDFTFARLNPAAQRLLHLPARPVATFRQQFPGSDEAGIWAFHRDAYLAAEPSELRHRYQADGYDSVYVVAARRVGEQLLVSFTDSADPTHPAAESARQAQAARQATRLETAQQQAQQREGVFQVLEQAPAAIVLLREPNHRIEYVNPAYQQLFPSQQLQGYLITEAHPSVSADGTLARLDHVYKTGTPYVGEEQAVPLPAGEGQPDQVRYFNYTYQPYREAGRIVGVTIFAYDVTAPVLARRTATTALAQQQKELETRVQERTREAQAARLATERERELLQALLTQAPVAIALFQGPDTRITTVNDRMAALWGRTTAQVLGRTLLEALPELRDQGFNEMIQAVRTTGVPYVGTEAPATLLQNGELATRYYNFVCQPVYDAQNELLGVLNVSTEVTEQIESRRRIEQLVQEAEVARQAAERQRGELERVFEQAPIAIAVYRGPNYVIQLANATVARLWGRTREQLIGKGLFEALPEVAGMGYEELLDGVMATGVPHVSHAMEAQHERDGHLDTVYWDFVYVPTYAADGSIDGAMVVASEVTAQVQARRQVEQLNQELDTRVQERTRQLTEQQLLLRQILGQVPAAIATLSGPDHRFTFFNELYQTLTANRPALGQAAAEALPEVVEQGFIGLLDQVYATGEPFVGTDVPLAIYDAATGQPRQYYIDFIYQPLFDGQRRVQGILAFILDVTDRALARQLAHQSRVQVQELNEELAAINEELRATNEELHGSNTRLIRTNTDLDTFVYTASHDLKAPITNIEGLLDALRDYLPADGAEPMIPYLLGLMENSVARFQLTIGQLTDISRLQNAAQEPAEPLDLAALIENIRLDLAPVLASVGGQLLVDVADCPTVVFSPKNLRSIVYNLLSNALKYRDPDRAPVVQVRATSLTSQVQLEVQDNGLGLSEMQQGKLFTLFQRLHTHVEGTGVGLYMLKRIVDNAEGTIQVQSQPGVGSTFTVLLPRR